MLIIISPAKTLDFSEETRFTDSFSQPEMLQESQLLIRQLAKMSENKISKLMNISDKLAALNHERYQRFSVPFSPVNAKQALLAFRGDVYLGFDLQNYSEADYAFAQDRLRILSGLYGLLKPLDLIQPYRLEMGTQLKTRRGKDLYAFWGGRITKQLQAAMEAADTDILINLASHEYFKSVRQDKLKGRIITPIFKEERDGQLKMISLFAKKARGLMSNFAIKHRLTDVEELKHFREEGYTFRPGESSESQWLFAR